MYKSSPVYSAVQKIIELFDFEKDVSVYSYRDCFDSFWGISGKSIDHDGGMWCVVDDHETPLRWLPSGIWGRYYRSRNGIKAPKLILVGEKFALYPPRTNDSIYIPEFYEDEGFKRISFESKKEKEFVIEFISAIKELKEWQDLIKVSRDEDKIDIEKDLSPDDEKVKAWQGLLYATLSSPGKRHSVSNEIAPMILRDAIINLHTLPDKTQLITEFQEALKSNSEQKALLEFWKWISEFNPYLPEKRKEVDINRYLITDVWNIWTGGIKFLLIDDQAELGYRQIVEYVLKLVVGENTCLDMWTNLPEGWDGLDKKIGEITRDYKCIFLDLRLKDEDLEKKSYDDLERLTGVRIAKRISENDKQFPVILFSSSQLREVDSILPQKNIIHCFRKPGIAGSGLSIDGNEALNRLFEAIKMSLEMMENRLVYEKWMNIKKEYQGKNLLLEYKLPNRQVKEEIGIFFDDGLITRMESLFESIFIYGQYKEAFSFPYNFFEEKFDEYGKYKDINLLEDIELVSKNKDNIEIRDLDKKGNKVRPTIKLKNNSQPLRLNDLEVKQSSQGVTPNLNLNIRAFTQFRNMAAHGIKGFEGMRREAIGILILFLDTLANRYNHGKLLSGRDLSELGRLEITAKNRFGELYHPLYRPAYGVEDTKVRDYVYDHFACLCYYGNNSSYQVMYALLKNHLAQKND